jgi:hypothetical protein
MPLSHSKSKNAFSKNVAAEMNAGKPQKQSVAIAYSEQRKASHKAHGGDIEACGYCNGGESYDKMSEEGMYSEGGKVAERMDAQPHNYDMGGSVEHEEAKQSLHDLLDQKSMDLKYMHAPNGMAHGGEASADSEESNMPMIDSKRLSQAIRAKKKKSMELEAQAEQSNAEDAADDLQHARVDSEVGFGHEKTSSEGGDLSDEEYTEMDGPGLKRRMRLKKMLSGLVQGKGAH